MFEIVQAESKLFFNLSHTQIPLRVLSKQQHTRFYFTSLHTPPTIFRLHKAHIPIWPRLLVKEIWLCVCGIFEHTVFCEYNTRLLIKVRSASTRPPQFRPMIWHRGVANDSSIKHYIVPGGECFQRPTRVRSENTDIQQSNAKNNNKNRRNALLFRRKKNNNGRRRVSVLLGKRRLCGLVGPIRWIQDICLFWFFISNAEFKVYSWRVISFTEVENCIRPRVGLNSILVYRPRRLNTILDDARLT